MSAAKYRKRPVVIEAMQFDGGNPMPVLVWAAAFGGKATFEIEQCFESGETWLVIPTLEGVHRASAGDFIIRGVKGEFYPCKPDIFALTYEPVEDSK